MAQFYSDMWFEDSTQKGNFRLHVSLIHHKHELNVRKSLMRCDLFKAILF